MREVLYELPGNRGVMRGTTNGVDGAPEYELVDEFIQMGDGSWATSTYWAPKPAPLPPAPAAPPAPQDQEADAES